MKNSPLNELTAQDIARKQRKLDRIDKRIERKDDKFKAKVSSGKKGTDMDITRHERSLMGLKERKHKTEYQIETGERGRPTSLKNEAWLAGTSRKSSSPVNNYKDGYYGVERKSALNMLGVSPLNNDSIRNDSINRDIAIKKFKQDYADVGKVKSGEYDREKGEFHWDGNKISLIPTDDGEVQITKGIQPKNQGKNWK
jgi:hypothetical protein